MMSMWRHDEHVTSLILKFVVFQWTGPRKSTELKSFLDL